MGLIKLVIMTSLALVHQTQNSSEESAISPKITKGSSKT